MPCFFIFFYVCATAVFVLMPAAHTVSLPLRCRDYHINIIRKSISLTTTQKAERNPDSVNGLWLCSSVSSSVCNFMCHEKCLKTLRKVCSSMTPSLVQVSIQHTLMLQTPNEPKCVTTDTGQCWPDASGVGATRVKTGGRCCVRKQRIYIYFTASY